jgi:D-alanine--D-alanine ligase
MRTKAEIETAFAPRERLADFGEFYLVGIGGAGMSALALMLLDKGARVSGSDAAESDNTRRLAARGVVVRIGHDGRGVQAGQAVVLSDAIDLAVSPEVAAARALGSPIFRRSQLLGFLLKDKKVLAVTGTHGKTTTTGMLACALREAGLDPTAVVGAPIPQLGGAAVSGSGEFAVVEACEAYDSLHDLDPFIAVLTNLELDHKDFHGSYEALRASVLRFVDRVPAEGRLIYCEDDAGAREVAAATTAPTLPYRASDIAFELHIPGEHNQANAAGALAAANLVGAGRDLAQKGIAEFEGAERRLQVLREGPITVVDDYAHHPTEIAASLTALRRAHPGRNLVVVFQPHLYSRTEGAYEAFADALSLADRVVITDIYPAREAPIPGVSSARIAEAIRKPVLYVPCRHLLPREVASFAREGDLICGMGAGTIGEFAPALLRELDRKGRIKVAVVYGGESAEREVSIHSGRSVCAALVERDYDAKLVDVSDLLLGTGNLGVFVGPDRPDVAFLAVHGSCAEDGALQGLMELLHIPYTGSGIEASAIAMDKALSKQVFERAGLTVPQGELLTEASSKPTLRPPVVVKPNAQGSTIGLSFVEDEKDLEPAIERAFQYGDAVLVEEWVRGVETSTPVLGDRALPPVEVVPRGGRYDFASKYEVGATEEIVPARLPEETLVKLRACALDAHRALGCRGATRTDVIVRDGGLVVLETNTLPGMTSTSLLPNSAKSVGMSYADVVEWIVQEALQRHAKAT